MRPGAEQAGDADNLAAAERQRRPARLQLAQLEQRLAGLSRAAGIEVIDLAAHHQLDDGLRRQLRRRTATGVAAVAQDDDAIGDRFDLFDEVRDVDDGEALRLETADQREEPLDVGVGEAARRLVEHDDAGAARQSARDLDQLLRRR